MRVKELGSTRVIRFFGSSYRNSKFRLSFQFNITGDNAVNQDFRMSRVGFPASLETAIDDCIRLFV
jgi:hypothetical protein